MAFTDSEWGHIFFEFTRELRAGGLAIEDEVARMHTQPSANRGETFCRYLELIIDTVRAQSQSGYSAALQSLQEGIELEDGGRVEGIELIVSERDKWRFSVEQVSLADVVDNDAVLNALSEVLRMVNDARDQK